MKITIQIDVTGVQGQTDEDLRANWVNNKVTAQIAAVIDGSCAVGHVVNISTQTHAEGK